MNILAYEKQNKINFFVLMCAIAYCTSVSIVKNRVFNFVEIFVIFKLELKLK